MKDRDIADKVVELLDVNKNILQMFGVLLFAGWLVFQLAALGILTVKMGEGKKEKGKLVMRLNEAEEVFLYGFVFSFWAITTITFASRIFMK